MITQNVDNDILALNYKDTLETIDKSHNIQFIYHLYNLFKMAINKYKDFRKVVLSKKEVYEKLLFSNGSNGSSGSEANVVNDEVISHLTEELSSLHDEERRLRDAFHAIPIDIHNPSNASIIATDYTSLMKEIESEHSIVSPEVLEEYREKLNHYKYLTTIRFGSRHKNDCDTLYSQQLEDDFKKLPCVNKPCDISYLANEKKGLEQYVEDDGEADACEEDEECEASAPSAPSNALATAKNALNELVANKPDKVSGSRVARDIEKILKNIRRVYGSIDAFNDFITSHTKPIKRTRGSESTEPITIGHYTDAVRQKDVLMDAIRSIHTQLATFENDFNTLFSKQQSLKTVNIPCERYGVVKSAKSAMKELRQYNMDSIHLQIAEDDANITEHTKMIEEIHTIAIEIDGYTKELQLFDTNEEYRYNPECLICSNRPWVSRIKEIHIIIRTLHTNIDVIRRRMKYNESEFAIIQERFEENKKRKANYHLLTEWYHYYKFKEARDTITNDLNTIIHSKATLHEELTVKEVELNANTAYIEHFVTYTFMLYEEYLCDIYKVWETKYKEAKRRVEDLEKTIHYNDVIRPRIAKYRELQKSYDEWVSYDNTKKIIDTHHYYTLKAIIEANEVYHEYQSNERMKPMIRHKLELNATLKEKERDVKSLNDKIVKYATINAYNNENKKNYNSLIAIESELDTIIDVIDTILINFQAFRKELYDTMILSQLVEKTNGIIKTLCHQNTKPFKLNYNVDISNDTVHINWLIHNENVSKEGVKQYISVSQASGFQRFAISLALRMSLYFNNYDVLCRQLFIDEGFINFDKNNLSIVPVFLKSLLHYFNTIVILSHIDIIQDSVDETSEIRFDKTNGVSSIVYR
jgi:DNA repair exonuclease SbcCD ATPase subunit